jgi:hypothetical protein
MTFALTVAGVVLIGVAGLVWFIARIERQAGQLDIRSKTAEKEAADAHKAGEIMAEHRERGAVVERLRDGGF